MFSSVSLTDLCFVGFLLFISHHNSHSNSSLFVSQIIIHYNLFILPSSHHYKYSSTFLLISHPFHLLLIYSSLIHSIFFPFYPSFPSLPWLHETPIVK